jgi:O-antigen/teichoic acid export membrane protein
VNDRIRAPVEIAVERTLNEPAKKRNGGKRRKSTKHLAIRGVLANWIGRFLSLAITFVVTPIIIHSLGNEAYGLWAMIMSLGSYYALADIGLHGASVKYIAQYEAKGDISTLSKVVTTSLAVYWGLALCVVLLAAPIAWVLPTFVELHEQTAATVGWTVFLTGATFAVKLTAHTFDASLSALKRFDITNMLSLVLQILQAASMIIVIRLGYGLVGMAVTMLAVTVLERVAKTLLAIWLLPAVSISLSSIDRTALREIFSFSSLNVLRQLANRMASYSGNLIVGLILGPAMVTFYALAESLQRKSLALEKGISSVTMPVASELAARERYEDLRRLFLFVPRLQSAIGLLIATIFIVMGRSIFDLWIGPGYSVHAYPLLCLLALGLVIGKYSGGMQSLLAGTGQIALAARMSVIRGILTIPCMVLFVWAFGLIGAGYGLLVPRIVVDGFILPHRAIIVYGSTWSEFLLKSFLPSLIAVGPSAVVAILLMWLFPPARLLHLGAHAAVVVCIAAITSYWVVLDSDLRSNLLPSLALSFHR